METSTLLPCIDGIEIDSITAQHAAIVVRLSTVALSAACPLCGRLSERVHSRYERTLTDLPWNRITVRLHLRTRKFFCDNGGCQRQVFTEPIPELAARYARKTARLSDTLLRLTYIIGGEAATRIARMLGLLVSPDGLLKHMKKQAAKRCPVPTPRAVGIDDFAFRRGDRYGTILIDLETHKPLDLLPDREGATVEKWLRDHPGIQIVSRDRSTTFAEAVREALPDALQVADRFHLTQNLMEAVEKQVAKHYSTIRQCLAPLAPSEQDEGPARLSRRQERAREESRQRRLERWQQVQDMFKQGYAKKEIARMLSMDKNTVRDYLRTDTFPERKARASPPGKLDVYGDYLARRWNEGCQNALQLWREIKAQGFTGGATSVRDLVRAWRSPSEEDAPVVCPISAVKIPSVRSLAWSLVKDKRGDLEHRALVDRICQECPVLISAKQLALSFFGLIRKQSKSDLSEWQAQVYASGLSELVTFARGLDRDRAAVEAALSEPWSNGMTEGHVNRLKFIKRQGYGRSSFALLKARVLPLAA